MTRPRNLNGMAVRLGFYLIMQSDFYNLGPCSESKRDVLTDSCADIQLSSVLGI